MAIADRIYRVEYGKMTEVKNMDEKKKQPEELNNTVKAQTVRAKAILEIVRLFDERQRRAERQQQAEAAQSGDTVAKREKFSGNI